MVAFTMGRPNPFPPWEIRMAIRPKPIGHPQKIPAMGG